MEPFEIKGTLNPEDISDGDFYRFNMVTRQKFEDGEFSKTDYSYIGDYFNIGYEETRHRKLSRIFLSFDPWNEHGYEVTDVTLYTYLTFVPIHEPDHAYGLLVLTEHTDEDAPGGCVDMIIKYKMFDKNMTAYQTVQCMMEYIDQCAKELLTSKLYNIKMMEGWAMGPPPVLILTLPFFSKSLRAWIKALPNISDMLAIFLSPFF